MWGIQTVVSLPVLEDVSSAGDQGRPYVLQYPISIVGTEIEKLAMGVIAEIARLKVRN